MGLVLQLVETRADGGTRSVALMKLGRPGNLRDIADLGLTLPEAKQLLACLQQAVVVVQARDHATLWPDCASCGERFRIKDWRFRRVATLFGEVVVRLLRFRCPGCGRGETGTNWPAHRRSTPELDQLQAPLSALMTDRPAAGMLAPLLLVAAGTSYGTLRRHTLELGERVRNAAMVEPDAVDAAAAPAIARSLDAMFLRSCPEGEQHLEGRIGNAETSGDGRQLFGAVANAGTDIMAQIRRALDTIGRTSDTEPTAFTDGCSSVRFILAAAGVTDPPILDWFHLSLRLQHAKQAAGGLPADGPDRAQARGNRRGGRAPGWRTCNRKVKEARITLERIHALLASFEGKPARKLRRALDAVDRSLCCQSAPLVDDAERHWAGLRVGTSLSEGTANFQVNRRRATSQQRRWSRRGADLLLQVRCAVYNGTLGTGFGSASQPPTIRIRQQPSRHGPQSRDSPSRQSTANSTCFEPGRALPTMT